MLFDRNKILNAAENVCRAVNKYLNWLLAYLKWITWIFSEDDLIIEKIFHTDLDIIVFSHKHVTVLIYYITFLPTYQH